MRIRFVGIDVPSREVYGHIGEGYVPVEGFALPDDCDGWTPFKIQDRGASNPQEGEDVHSNRVGRTISRTHIRLNVWMWKP